MKGKEDAMKTIDRLIFGTIAVALMLLALQPYLARRRGQGRHNPHMSISELCDLDIPGLTANQSVLFL